MLQSPDDRRIMRADSTKLDVYALPFTRKCRLRASYNRAYRSETTQQVVLACATIVFIVVCLLV